LEKVKDVTQHEVSSPDQEGKELPNICCSAGALCNVKTLFCWLWLVGPCCVRLMRSK